MPPAFPDISYMSWSSVLTRLARVDLAGARFERGVPQRGAAFRRGEAMLRAGRGGLGGGLGAADGSVDRQHAAGVAQRQNRTWNN